MKQLERDGDEERLEEFGLNRSPKEIF